MEVDGPGRRLLVLMGCFLLIITSAVSSGIPAYASQTGSLPQMLIVLSQQPISNGQMLRYDIAYRNVGGSQAQDVVIKNPIPVGAQLVSGSISAGGHLIQPQSGSGNAEIHWLLGDVDPGGHGIVSYAIYLSSSSPTATPTPMNTIAVHVAKTLVFPLGRPAEIGKDAYIQWQVVLRNDGALPLRKLPLEDSWRFVCMHSGAAANPSPDHVTGDTLQWTDLTGSGTLAPGQSITVTVRTVPVGACSPAWNQASVTGAEDENGVPVLGMADSAAVRIVAPTPTKTPVPPTPMKTPVPPTPTTAPTPTFTPAPSSLLYSVESSSSPFGWQTRRWQSVTGQYSYVNEGATIEWNYAGNQYQNRSNEAIWPPITYLSLIME